MIHRAVTASMVVLHLLASTASLASDESMETSAFPPTVVTNQEKIEWLTTEAERAMQAVEAEADRPVPQQREALYRAILTRGAGLLRLIGTIPERLPRLEGRVNDAMTKAMAGLERIANAALKIGMDAEQVRQARGDPKHITEVTTAAGTRQQWDYGATVLSFENGTLVEIRQILQR